MSSESKNAGQPGLAARLFLLRSFLTPVLIEWVHLLGVVGILLSGLTGLLSSARQAVETNPYGQYGGLPGYHSPLGLLGGGPLVTMVITVAALIGWRVSCELTILLFRIHSELRALREQVK